MNSGKENIRNTKPISLFPLKPEEALKRAMSVNPQKKKRHAAKKKPKG